MLEGLEAVEIYFSDVKNVIDFRIESEYFLHKFLENDRRLKRIATVTGTKAAIFKNGRAFNSDEFNLANGIRVSKIGDVTNRRAPSNWEYVTAKEFQIQNAEYLCKGDILMSLTGDPPDVGKVNMVTVSDDLMTWNQRVAKLEVVHVEAFSNHTLYVLLSSEFCRMQLERYAKGIRQRNLGNESFERLLVPVLPKQIRVAIDKLVLDANQAIEQSRSTYFQAENILLGELSMADFSPAAETVNIKSFKDSFAATGRLDAEYYQPKYEAYQSHVFNSAAGWDSLANICNLKDCNYTPKEASEYAYIELADIDKSGSVTGCTRAIGKELPSRARRKVETGDVLISSIEGSLTSCAIVPKSLDGALCSTGFYVVDSDKINSETLLVLFKSELMQNLLKQSCSGTILTAINKAEFCNLPVPRVDANAQQKIADLVKESFSLKAESERLLAVAKRGVEIAIEQDEAAAMRYIVANSPITERANT